MRRPGGGCIIGENIYCKKKVVPMNDLEKRLDIPYIKVQPYCHGGFDSSQR